MKEGGSGALLSVTLGPGILQNIFDGIERPLRDMEKQSGSFIATGLHFFDHMLEQIVHHAGVSIELTAKGSPAR